MVNFAAIGKIVLKFAVPIVTGVVGGIGAFTDNKKALQDEALRNEIKSLTEKVNKLLEEK